MSHTAKAAKIAMNTIRIAIAEDQTIVRQGLVRLLSDYSEFEVVAVARNGRDLIKKIKNVSVDLILLDEEMPEMDGRQTLTVLTQFYPAIKVVFLTIRESLQNLSRLILSGAKTVINKSVDFEVLVEAIREVYVNEFFCYGNLTPELLSEILNTPEMTCSILKGDGLTKREIEIVQLICEGKSNGEISLGLSLSQRTIENHRQRISKKTGCRTTAELVVNAIRNGIYEI